MNYNIPEDILVSEILKRLPVKSLLKFRCVSKSWCSLISYDEAFIKSHLKNSTNNKSFTHHAIISSSSLFKTNLFIFKQCSFSCWFYEPTAFVSDKFTIIGDNFSPPQGCFMVGCCNGLCCLQNYDLQYSLQDEFFLWNPATGKSHKLPAYVGGNSDDDEYHYTLAGFGFDEVHHDYKVLAIKFYYYGVVMVRLYSFRTNSWKAVENSFKYRTYFHRISAKFLNGRLHWVGGPSLIGNDPGMIYCFDLEREVHGIVEEPNYDRANGCFLQSIGVLDKCLSCITINPDLETLQVWVMKDYGKKESWNKLVSISFQYIFNMNTDYEPFCTGQGGEIMFSDRDYSRFIVYDPKNNSCTSLSQPHMSSLCADVYVQSLVSPVPPSDRPISGNVPGLFCCS